MPTATVLSAPNSFSGRLISDFGREGLALRQALRCRRTGDVDGFRGAARVLRVTGVTAIAGRRGLGVQTTAELAVAYWRLLLAALRRDAAQVSALAAELDRVAGVAIDRRRLSRWARRAWKARPLGV